MTEFAAVCKLSSFFFHKEDDLIELVLTKVIGKIILVRLRNDGKRR
ncbi:hypothetical protein KKG61_07210 [bacterium]|nr:hypothetical protein [bacterium]